LTYHSAEAFLAGLSAYKAENRTAHLTRIDGLRQRAVEKEGV
jgi:hypothetical protein